MDQNRTMDAVTEKASDLDITLNPRRLGAAVFFVRLLMAPFYIGMLGVIALLLAKFAQKLFEAFGGLLAATSQKLIPVTLGLVDLALVANLVSIVAIAGWAQWVAPPRNERRGTLEYEIGRLNFGEVKLKLIASISAITAIQILETFVHVEDYTTREIAWQLAIMLGIAVVGVLLAWTDRLAQKR